MKSKDDVKAFREFDTIFDKGQFEDYYKLRFQMLFSLPDKEFMEELDLGLFKSDFIAQVIKRRGLEKKFAQFHNQLATSEIAELQKPDCNQKHRLKTSLKRRFQYVTPKYKREILDCMLGQPTKTEREWACQKLRKNWDPYFTEKCMELFERHHEFNCALLVLERLPHPYIYENRKKLSEILGILKVIYVLGNEYPDILEFDKLTAGEKLRAIVNLNLVDRCNEVEKMLYDNLTAEIEYILSAGKIKSRHQITIDTHNTITWGKANTGEETDYFESLFDRDMDFYMLDNYWNSVPLGHLAYYFNFPTPDESFDGCSKTLTLLSINGTYLCLWAMGKLGMTQEILRFAKIDKKLQVKIYSCFHEEIPTLIDDWLFKILNTLSAEGV